MVAKTRQVSQNTHYLRELNDRAQCHAPCIQRLPLPGERERESDKTITSPLPRENEIDHESEREKRKSEVRALSLRDQNGIDPS